MNFIQQKYYTDNLLNALPDGIITMVKFLILTYRPKQSYISTRLPQRNIKKTIYTYPICYPLCNLIKTFYPGFSMNSKKGNQK